MKTNLDIYVNNNREIYCVSEWLASCVAKRMKKGQPVTIEHLANCSTMKRIVKEGVKLVQYYDGMAVPKEDRKEFAELHARYIIEDFAPAFL